MSIASFPSSFFRSSVWFTAFAVWLMALWFLSGRPVPEAPTVDIPGFDKVLHFTYFLIGAILLSIALHLRRDPRRASFPWSLLVVTISLAAIGALDEWHQSWIPTRSGNDLGDWIADVLGSLTGALACKVLLGYLPKHSTP